MSGRKCNNRLPRKGNDQIDHDGVVDCPPVILKPDCDALRSGNIPSSDDTASAKLSLEVTTTTDDAIEQLDRALDEAALIVMTCPAPRANRELQEVVNQEVVNKPPNGPNNGPPSGPTDGPLDGTHDGINQVSLNGYTVGKLSKSSRGT